MSRTFRRHGDRIRMQLEPVEVELLRSTRDGLRRTLEEGDPDDPVIRRLFPPAVADDPSADDELRDLMRNDLLARQLEALDELVAILDRGRGQRGLLRVDLTSEEAVLVLGAVNQLRLAIGARIGIEQLDRDRLDEDDPVAYRVAVMDHLGWMQEQLLAILDPPSVRFHGQLGVNDIERWDAEEGS